MVWMMKVHPETPQKGWMYNTSLEPLETERCFKAPNRKDISETLKTYLNPRMVLYMVSLASLRLGAVRVVQWCGAGGAVVRCGWCSGAVRLVQWCGVGGAVVRCGWCSGAVWVVQWCGVGGAVVPCGWCSGAIVQCGWCSGAAWVVQWCGVGGAVVQCGLCSGAVWVVRCCFLEDTNMI